MVMLKSVACLMKYLSEFNHLRYGTQTVISVQPSFFIYDCSQKSLLCNSSTWSFGLETSGELKLLGKTRNRDTFEQFGEIALEGNLHTQDGF